MTKLQSFQDNSSKHWTWVFPAGGGFILLLCLLSRWRSLRKEREEQARTWQMLSCHKQIHANPTTHVEYRSYNIQIRTVHINHYECRGIGAIKGCWCQVIEAPRVSMPDTHSFSYKAPSSEPVTEEDLKVGWHCAVGRVFCSNQKVKSCGCWMLLAAAEHNDR